MKVEILAIGSEILLGGTVNTNAAYLSHELIDLGYCVCQHTVLPDDPQILEGALPQILQRNDIVVVTGGLGPTCDDLTRDVFAKFFGAPLVFSKEVAQDLEKRFGKNLATLQDQSMVPEGSLVFSNPLGTAPAIVFIKNDKVVVLLPGVPQEMKALFTEKIGPFLEKNYLPKQKSYSSSFHLALLYESTLDPFLRRVKADFPKVDIGIYPFYGTLTVRVSSYDRSCLSAVSDRFLSVYGDYVFSLKSPRLAEALQEVMVTKGSTLALAESFTGGAIATCLTSIPGSSQYFLGSIVSYANSLKESQLHVSSKSLAEKGAVSEEVAKEMLKGLLFETKADYGIAVTGVAGPDGGSKDKPVGTVWVAIGEKQKVPYVAKWQLKGSREVIITSGTYLTLGHLWRWIAKGTSPFSKSEVF